MDYTLSTCIKNNPDDILLSADQERDVCLSSSLEKLPRPPALRISRPPSSQGDQGAGGQRAASLSRATNETTRGMRAFLLLLLVAATLSDALSTLNGRVDEEHNAIVVEGMWLVQCMQWRISSVPYFSLVSKSVYAARPVSATNKQNGNEATSSPLVRAVRIFDDISSCSLTVDFDTDDIWGSEAEKVFSTKRTVLSGVRILIRQIWAAPPAERPNGGLTSTANKWNKVNKLSQLDIFSSSNCLGLLFEGWLCKTLINQNPDSK